jgi:signal peptidase II
VTSDLQSPPKPSAKSRLALSGAAILVVAAALAADRLSKAWALSALADGETVPLLPGVRLQLAFNPGAAFGMGVDFGPVMAVGILVILLALSSWIYWGISRGTPRWSLLLLTAAAAGGWGNMYDRISRADRVPLSGTVIDMIAVDWFAIFNVADIFAVVGIVTWATLHLTWRGATTGAR